jgi:hypothetical protein
LEKRTGKVQPEYQPGLNSTPEKNLGKSVTASAAFARACECKVPAGDESQTDFHHLTLNLNYGHWPTFIKDLNNYRGHQLSFAGRRPPSASSCGFQGATPSGPRSHLANMDPAALRCARSQFAASAKQRAFGSVHCPAASASRLMAGLMP